jgi:GntR family transcriptional regulator
MIDREGPVPPYRQVAAILRQRITSGQIPPGRAIPSIVQMEAEFEVARDTLRKAVQILKEEGLVETVRGMGVYVRQPPADG